MALFPQEKATSEFLSGSVGVNPVVIRNAMRQLKAAGLVEVFRGKGGAALFKPAYTLTLLDVYKATEVVGEDALFNFHGAPNAKCPVGKNIHALLDGPLNEAQAMLETSLANVTLEDLIGKLE
jgi:DNA-binding IscR family transcriptional regulator